GSWSDGLSGPVAGQALFCQSSPLLTTFLLSCSPNSLLVYHSGRALEEVVGYSARRSRTPPARRARSNGGEQTMRNLLILSLAALTLLGAAARAGEPRPSLLIETVYPGANARGVAETVARPIEVHIAGVEKMLHLRSRCAKDGTYTLTVVFKDGVDLDRARTDVQQRVALALPTLPEDVKRHGVTVKKMPQGVLTLLCVSSPDD